MPSWLPSYTPQQLALLRPVDVPIQIPAARVFPDLSRFGYGDNRKLEDARDSFKVTKLVATVLDDSPRFYALDQAPPELSNTIAQYGPAGPDEADGFRVVQRNASGEGALVPAPLSADARADVERANSLGKSEPADAIKAWTGATTKSPKVPALWLSLGESLQQARDLERARAAFVSSIEIDPTFASGHRALAELYLESGDLGAARREIAEALAYHPSSKRALAVADRLTLGEASSGRGRVMPFPIFLDVDAVGAIHVGSPGGNPTQMYAGCRAVFRYEPEIRSALLHEPPETPYYLTVLEEVVCMEAAIGAYLFELANEDESASPEPSMDALIELAQSEGLSGYAMFEVLGKYRPERARTAPPGLHSAMVRYIDRYVLQGREDLPSGVYTAAR